MDQNSRAFTTVANHGILNVLKNQCRIAQSFGPNIGTNAPQIIAFDAIWDTGATNSVISATAVKSCKLIPISMAQVNGVHGTSTVNVYLVDIYLPNNVMFRGVQVTEGCLVGADILIGMDIINQGDFAVTNKNGITKFSFLIPSQVNIDFVAQVNNSHQKKTNSKTQTPRTKKPKKFGKNKK